MSEWKQAWNIALLEMKLNKLGHLTILFFAAIYLTLIVATNEELSSSIAVDLVMIFLVWLPMAMRGKNYTGQKVENDLYASRFVMLLTQFPIAKEAIIKSRVIMTLLFNVFLNLCFLTIIYFFTEAVHTKLSGLSAIVFILFWVSFGYLVGAFMPASEIGAMYSLLKLIMYSILLYGSIIVVLFIFHNLLGMSLFSWSIYVAKEHTVLTLFVLVILTIASHLYGIYEARKAIRRVDYYL